MCRNGGDTEEERLRWVLKTEEEFARQKEGNQGQREQQGHRAIDQENNALIM